MSANAIEREKYLHLISQVEDLEERVATLEQQNKAGDELRLLQEQLANARRELQLVSDGCGVPHAR